MVRAFRLLGALAPVFVAAACVQVYPPSAPSPAAGTATQQEQKKEEEKKEEDKDKKPFKPWDEVLKDTRAVEGYFTFHIKRDNTVYLELAPEQLEADFGMALYIRRGVSEMGLNAGLPASAMQLMRFRRVGDEIHLVHRNPRYTADPDSPILEAVRANVGHSIVAALKIESEHEESKHLLVDATPFFVSDYAEFADWLKFVYRNSPVTLDKDRSYVERILGFPENVELDVALTYKSDAYPRWGASNVADVRSVPLVVRYSLIALPDTLMRPRLADDRVGHFLTAVWDYSQDRPPTAFRRYVERWRLEKQDHTAEISEPVEPIVYYIDHSVPMEYRRYVREGIEAWNKAFEAAGFRNAVVAREAPNDTAWSAEDARYSTIRWTADPGGWAIGPSETDPRTGEILNADILISSSFVTYLASEYQELAGPGTIAEQLRAMQGLARKLSPDIRHRLCLAGPGKAHQLRVQYALLVGLGVLDGALPVPDEYLGDALRDLVMHEVGHTLGLRHNFKASSGIPHDRLNDTTFTGRHGVTLSVMDYGPVNVAPDPDNQGHYWNRTVGTYDVWAIQYAYATIYEQPPTGPLVKSGTPVSTPEEELVGLRKIARQAADSLHTYGTDEDNWLGPWAVDPLTNGWDLGSDPLEFAADRVAVISRVQPRLEQRLIGEGDGYQRLRRAVTSLIAERLFSVLPVTKTVGGMHVARDHKGDPDGRLPFTPIPAQRQREAVRVIVDNAFAEDAFQFDPELLNKLAPNRWSHWGVGWFRIPLDFPVHQWVATVQGWLLWELMDPVRLQRMIDNEVRTPAGTEPYRVSELFETTTSAIWSELEQPASPRRIDSYRRNLQRIHVGVLIDLLIEDRLRVPADGRSLARYELSRLGQQIDTALGSGVPDTMTRAHLEESQARIEKALEVQLVKTR